MNPEYLYQLHNLYVNSLEKLEKEDLMNFAYMISIYITILFIFMMEKLNI